MIDAVYRANQAMDDCFVYQVVSASVDVRCRRQISDAYCTGETFQAGDLVAVDSVGDETSVEHGRFLRLADGSGWLLESVGCDTCLRPVDVATGLWTMVVDNYPCGIAARRHPIDRQSFRIERQGSTVEYQPLQTICCDRRVLDETSGTVFYRVQGTQGWVLDRRPVEGLIDIDAHYMLLPACKVRKGLFAYRCLVESLRIRHCPTAGSDHHTLRYIGRDELIVADAVRESPYPYGNGPFLHLADGSGWLFEYQAGRRVMEPMAVEQGTWLLKVLCDGLAARHQPIDDECQACSALDTILGATVTRAALRNTIFGLELAEDMRVECNAKIVAPNGVAFYRLSGFEAWIFDQRDGEPMLELLSHTSRLAEAAPSDGWSLDFIRGVAAAIGVQETEAVTAHEAVSFYSSHSKTHIHVYYATRTIGMCLDADDDLQCLWRDCSVDELMDVLRNATVHTTSPELGRPWHLEPTTVDEPNCKCYVMDKEHEKRQQIIKIDADIQALQAQKRSIWQDLQPLEEQRSRAALAAKEERIRRHEQVEDAVERVQLLQLVADQRFIDKKPKQYRKYANERHELGSSLEWSRLVLGTRQIGDVFGPSLYSPRSL